MGSRDSLSAMGISRDSFHKRRKTGGKLTPWRMKRKFELGRQPAETKIGNKRVRTVRVRGGNLKYRALRLDAGNFSWASESGVQLDQQRVGADQHPGQEWHRSD